MTRTARAEPRVDEAVEITVEHPLRIARAHTGAQVLHHLVRLQHIAANLTAPPDLALFAVELVHLGALLVLLFFVEPRFQDIHRRRAILDLRTFVLANHDNAGRDVREAHRGVRRVHALPAFAGGTIYADAGFVFRNLGVAR